MTALSRVYAPKGQLAHLLDIGVSASLELPARCGREAPSWLGTGSQREYEKAASLPLCSRCEHLSPDLPVAAAITVTGTEHPVPPVSPAGGTGPQPAPPPHPRGGAAKPAEPLPPYGGAGKDAPDGQSPVALGALAGLSSIITPTPEDSPALVPPPGARGAAPGGGATGGLSGEDWRKAVRQAQAGQAAAARNRRGKPRAKPGYQPGANRRQP